jgi:hypothetical protein
LLSSDRKKWAKAKKNTSLAQDKLEPVRNDKELGWFDVFQDVEEVFISSLERWYAYMFIRGMYIILVRS